MSTTINALPVLPARRRAAIREDSLFRRVRTWWVLVALFLIAQENGLFTVQDNTYYSLKTVKEYYESSASLLALTILLWVTCGLLMVGHIRRTLRQMVQQKALLAVVAFACLSTFWSQVPLVTFRHAVLLSFMCIFAWFFATYYSPSDQMRILLAAGVIVSLASVAMVLFFPQYGMASGGEWKGVLAQKNRFGLTIFFLFAGLPFCRLSSRRRVLAVALEALLPVALILLSQSRTSLVLAFILVAARIFGPWMTRMRRDQIPFLLWFVLFGALIVPLGLFAGRSLILSMLGRDITLTGRTEHWSLLVSYAMQHMWLGYGYQGFWTGTTGDSGRFIAMVGAGMRGADNGYVDLLLQFGLIGIGLLLVILALCMRDFRRLFREPSIPLAAFWYAGVLAAIFVGDITETMFWVPNGILTFMLVVACVGLRNLAAHDGYLPDERSESDSTQPAGSIGSW